MTGDERCHRFKCHRYSFSMPLICIAVLLGSNCPAVIANDLPLHQAIDLHIVTGWKSRKATPAARTNDAEFLRRVCLDLNGTIPSSTDVRAFLDDRDPEKRTKLIDRLLDSPQYARHMQHIFDVMLLERLPGGFLTDAQWQEYLRASFEKNKPWDQMVRDLVAADGNDPENRGAIRWLMIRNYGGRQRLVPNKIARDIGRMFLGINLQCAECHDHPNIDDYKQADFYGLAAFVNRTKIVNVRRNNRGFLLLAEDAEGDTKFRSVFDPGADDQMARPHMPGGQELDEPSFEKGKEYKVAPKAGVQQIPQYSRRSQLAKLLPSEDNELFKRNIVNRLWKLMLGRGLVEPVDLHHQGNLPSHPELLQELADRFAARKFDIKWFLRELALSRTYQLSSALPDGGGVPADSFAVAAFKPLRPRQLMMAIMQASGTADVLRSQLGDKSTEADLYKKLMEHAGTFTKIYGRPSGQPDTKTDPSLQQALFLSNSPLLLDWIKLQKGNLVDRLAAISQPKVMVEELYLSVYSRYPTADESAVVIDYLQGQPDDRLAVIQECVWALIASTEFRFNH